MARVIVNTSLTLDGVMQAPGRPDEDVRGGFQHGGWAQPYFDPHMLEVAREGMSAQTDLLLGRRTYEDFAKVWPSMPDDNPFKAEINASRKYVASRSLAAPLAWEHSQLLEGEAADAIADLKHRSGPDLVVLGSGELIRSLMERGLIDEYRLLIHPLVLGTGHRLFGDSGEMTKLQLVGTTTSSTGVVLATYRAG